jgi:DNA-binding beta-propeller fold protein YncE
MSAAIMRVTDKGTMTYVSKPEDIAADGLGLSARFGLLGGGIAFSKSNDMYVVDEGAHSVRKISPRGDVSTAAGVSNTEGMQNGPARAARFNAPTGLAINSETGVIYISDSGNNLIREYDPRTNLVTIFAGTVGSSESRAGDALLEASFAMPGQLAFFHDPLGDTVYVLDCLSAHYTQSNNNELSSNPIPDVLVGVRNGIVVHLADRTKDDGLLLFSFFRTHSHVVVDGSTGAVYIADYWNKRIVRWTKADGALLFFRNEGNPTRPSGLLFDAALGASLATTPSLLVGGINDVKQ